MCKKTVIFLHFAPKDPSIVLSVTEITDSATILFFMVYLNISLRKFVGVYQPVKTFIVFDIPKGL